MLNALRSTCSVPRTGRRGTFAGLLVLAFAAGALPTAQLVVRRALPEQRVAFRQANPGSATVRRVMGPRPALVVLVLEVAKAALPVLLGRFLGLSRDRRAALAFTPILGNQLIVRGKGAAAALGGSLALDPKTMFILAPGIIAGWVAGLHAPSMAGFYAAYPMVKRLLGRSRGEVGWSVMTVVALFVARALGHGRSSATLSPRVLGVRLLLDRDPG